MFEPAMNWALIRSGFRKPPKKGKSPRENVTSRFNRAIFVRLDSLTDGDRLSLIAFHSQGEVVFNSSIIDDGTRAAAHEQIESMQAWGTTDLAGGLELALAQLAAAPQNLEPADAQGQLTAASAGVRIPSIA